MLQVRALRQALKDVPATLDKNERFRRVSALVGGSYSKKECYDKYKELKAEAKLKQTAARNTSSEAAGANHRQDRRTAKKPAGATHNDNNTTLCVDDDCPPCTSPVGRWDDVERVSAGGSVAASAGSDLLSGRSSAFSSWSSHSAELCGQQQQHRHRRSTTSSTLSSVPSELQEDLDKGSGTELGIRGSTSHEEDWHHALDYFCML